MAARKGENEDGKNEERQNLKHHERCGLPPDIPGRPDMHAPQPEYHNRQRIEGTIPLSHVVKEHVPAEEFIRYIEITEEKRHGRVVTVPESVPRRSKIAAMVQGEMKGQPASAHRKAEEAGPAEQAVDSLEARADAAGSRAG